MNKILKQVVLLISLVVIGAVTIPAQKATDKKPAQKTEKKAPAEAKFLGRGDGIEYCAVSGEKLENKDIKGEFFGRTVYFCCENCLAKAQKNPELYVKKTEAEQIAATKEFAAKAEGHDHHATEGNKTAAKFLGKGDGITTCPVTGEPVNKNIKHGFFGRTVYFCCESCLEAAKKNPEKFIKP